MKKLVLALTLSGIFLTGTTNAVADVSHGLTIMGRLESPKSSCTVLMSKYVLNLVHDDSTLPPQGVMINNPYAYDHVDIQLGGENCDANEGYSKIGLKFMGTVDSTTGRTLANINAASDAATGVGIQLSDINNQILVPNTTIGRFPGSEESSAETTHAATFPLFISLVQLEGQHATPGYIQTNMTVQIERL